MDISRLKKVFAGMSAVAITLTQIGSVAAYSDVPVGVWYEDAVESFVDAGYLDAGQARFRGGDAATRAEFVKLVVELNGGILSTPPAVPSFDDVAPGAWYYGYFEESGKEGWVRGDGNCYGSHPCYARPGANVNRAEAAALIVRSFGLDSMGDAPRFVDNPVGQWYTDVIQTAADHCVLQGDGGTSRVRPGDNMNRAEMVVMLHRVDQGLRYGVDCGSDESPVGSMQITDAVAVSATEVEVEFSAMLDMDAAEDDSLFMITGPSGEISILNAQMLDDDLVLLTLGQALTPDEDYTLSVEDMMTEGGDVFSDSVVFMGYSSVVKGDGTLEVSLASSNPVGDTVPKGAVGAALLSLDLTASCDDAVILQQITVLHEGFGDETDIDGVYVAMDGGRISRRRTIDSEDQTADLRLSSPLTIPACGTRTVDIVADFASTAATSAEHNLAVELPSDVTSNALSNTGNFPLRGNTFRIAAVESGKITVSYRTVSPDEVEVGNKGVGIGKFELSVNSTEDQTLYSLTLEQNGTAGDGDYENIRIQRTDGTVLTNTVPVSVGDFSTLVFDPPFTILEGDKITLEVIADITGGAGDTLIMHFEESSDIFAVGSLYGYGVNGQLYGSQVTLPTTDNADTVTIDAGEFTIEIDGPVQQKYTRDDDDAILAKVLMTTGGEAVDIKDLYVAIQAQTSTGGGLENNATDSGDDNVHEVLEDVEIRNTRTGQTVSAVRLTGSSEFGTGTTSTSTFQLYRFDDFVVDGQDIWEFRVDFIDNGATDHPKTGDKFRVHICGETTSDTVNGCNFGGVISSTTTYNMKIEGLSTGDDVEDVRPGGTITGNFHRIANPELNIAVVADSGSDTAVKNSKNVNLLRFEARAGEAEDILFTKALFEASSGSLLNGQNYTLWVDTDGDSEVDTILESGVAAQSSSVTFQEMAGGGYLIPAEQSVFFEVHSNIAASLVNSDIQLRFATGSTYIEAEEADDGSSLSGIKTNSTCASTCDIIVTTGSSKIWVLANQGDLFVTKDTSPTRSRQLLGGTVGDAILRLQFRAENEDVEVTDLQLTASGSSFATSNSISHLELYKDDETSFFATATIAGCGSDDVLTTNPNGGAAVKTFCANTESQQLVIPEGERVDVLVRPVMKTDSAGGLINQKIQLFVSGQSVADDSTGSGAIRARGSESTKTLDANDGDTSGEGEIFIGTDTPTTNSARILGNNNVVVFAKITSITNANPDADNTNVPTGVSPFGQFKFTAAVNNNNLDGADKAVLSGIIFNVNATNVLLGTGDQTALGTSDFKLYNKSDSSTKHTCTASVATASGSMTVTCRNLSTGNVDVTLESGESTTFVLEGDVQNTQISASSTSTLQATIQDFTSISNTTFSTAASHLMWSVVDTDTTPFFWIEYPDTVVKSTSYKS